MSLQRHRRRLAGSEHVDEVYKNEDLRNAIADGAKFVNCTFIDCKLGQASFRGASFSVCHFARCDFKQAVFICRLVDTTFVECDFDQAVFATAILERVVFEECRLEYAVFSRATVLGGAFQKCQLHGAYFDLAESTGVDFSGSNLWGIVMPMSCAVIPENRFDHRQTHMFLALAMHARLEPEDRAMLELVTDTRMRQLVDRLVARQRGEEQAISEVAEAING